MPSSSPHPSSTWFIRLAPFIVLAVALIGAYQSGRNWPSWMFFRAFVCSWLPIAALVSTVVLLRLLRRKRPLERLAILCGVWIAAALTGNVAYTSIQAWSLNHKLESVPSSELVGGASSLIRLALERSREPSSADHQSAWGTASPLASWTSSASDTLRADIEFTHEELPPAIQSLYPSRVLVYADRIWIELIGGIGSGEGIVIYPNEVPTDIPSHLVSLGDHVFFWRTP